MFYCSHKFYRHSITTRIKTLTLELHNTVRILFYRHSITTRIKTHIIVEPCTFKIHSIVIPLQQGLRQGCCRSMEAALEYSIVIPLQQGLRRRGSVNILNVVVHSIVIPLQQGLRLFYSHYGCQKTKFYRHSIITRIKKSLR